MITKIISFINFWRLFSRTIQLFCEVSRAEKRLWFFPFLSSMQSSKKNLNITKKDKNQPFPLFYLKNHGIIVFRWSCTYKTIKNRIFVCIFDRICYTVFCQSRYYAIWGEESPGTKTRLSSNGCWNSALCRQTKVPQRLDYPLREKGETLG